MYMYIYIYISCQHEIDHPLGVLLHLRACFKQVEATFMLKVSYMSRAAIGNAKLLVPG